MSTSNYKVLTDIDLSANNILNVSKIEGNKSYDLGNTSSNLTITASDDRNEKSSVIIKGNKHGGDVELQSENTEEGTRSTVKVSPDKVETTSDKIDLHATSTLSVNGTDKISIDVNEVNSEIGSETKNIDSLVSTYTDSVSVNLPKETEVSSDDFSFTLDEEGSHEEINDISVNNTFESEGESFSVENKDVTIFPIDENGSHNGSILIQNGEIIKIESNTEDETSYIEVKNEVVKDNLTLNGTDVALEVTDGKTVLRNTEIDDTLSFKGEGYIKSVDDNFLHVESNNFDVKNPSRDITHISLTEEDATLTVDNTNTENLYVSEDALIVDNDSTTLNVPLTVNKDTTFNDGISVNSKITIDSSSEAIEVKNGDVTIETNLNIVSPSKNGVRIFWDESSSSLVFERNI